ncbi:MAG: FadR family transcriptional regulator [Alphaproteobacteria bacterium]|nr:FadR family transcriptional regulator [Alphaproteobacteria bacterium]
MTRHRTDLAAVRNADKPLQLQPLRPQRKLAEEAVTRISEAIRDGQLAPGARLPTEASLMRAMGVSRTVVREAVAALRAEGLVETRQGAGAFVAADDSRVPFRIEMAGPRALEEVLEVMELRLAVEVEAAALAAARASTRHVAAVRKALGAITAAIGRRESAVAEDFAFHRAIAAATGNARFVQFLAFLGRHLIPRQSVRAATASAAENLEYLERIQSEHARIAEAIAAGDPAAARTAMRTHLEGSLARYRKLASSRSPARTARRRR